jgi:hypothetical protein
MAKENSHIIQVLILKDFLTKEWDKEKVFIKDMIHKEKECITKEIGKLIAFMVMEY